MAEIAIGAALILGQSLIPFLQLEFGPQDSVINTIKRMNVSLGTMHALLKDTDGADGNEVQKDRVKQIRDIAYDIEDALDEFMLVIPVNLHSHRVTKFIHEAAHSISHQKAVHQVSSKIDPIQKQIDHFIKLEQMRVITPNQSLSASSSSSSIGNHMATPDITEEDNEILGLDEAKEEIIDKLIVESRPGRNILAVVGAGGSGKSALVKMVYSDRRIQSAFECCAWANAGRPFVQGDIISNLLAQFPMIRGASIFNEASGSNYDPGRRKHLIVLDNIWRKEDWEAIIDALPSGLSGSAVIVITRSTNVVEFSHVESPSYIHTMKALPNTIALQLFYKKAFRANNGNCPWELKDLASQIVQRCEGIPLAIAATGSFLSRKSFLPAEWKSLLDSLGSQIGINSSLSIITKTYLLSYYDLPSHLKSCFLYMGIFPEVKRGRLVRCWIAEGFVKKMNGKTLEETAEDYLNDLIGRSLIQAVSLDFDGRLRTCRAANLVREFIVMKSEENVFLTLVPDQDTSTPRIKGCRRICFLNSCAFEMSENIDMDRVRTLFTFTANIDYLPKLNTFKLLKVLDLQESGLDNFPDEIVALTLLRYLSLRSTRISSVPKSIKRLRYLETLDLKDTQIVRLPKEIFTLKKLRHLLVYHYNVSGSVDFKCKIGFEVTSSRGIGNLSDIQKLSLIKATTPPAHLSTKEGSIVGELGNLVHLRKLGLIDLKQEDGKKLCSSIQNMTGLSTLDVKSRSKEEYLDLNNLNAPVHLRRLYLKGRLRGVPSWLRSLDSLVRIGLRHSRTTENPLDMLQDLPNLIELEMTDAFLGQVLDFDANKFKKLKKLVVKYFEHLHTMAVQQGGLPSLKILSMRGCRKLTMLPLGINYIETLDELTLYDMPEEFIARLEKDSEDRHMVAHVPVIHSFTYNRHDSSWLYIDYSA